VISPNDGWEWTDTEGLADWIDMPVETVRVWRYRGGGPEWKTFGKHVRYYRPDVERWMSDRTRQVQPIG
jgi:hypothetical protein